MDELANSNCSAAGLDQVEVFVVTTARAASTNNECKGDESSQTDQAQE